MTLNLKWLLPFILPFVILATIRLLFWVAGAGWSSPGFAALASILVGLFVGFLCAAEYSGDNWKIRIGKGRGK